MYRGFFQLWIPTSWWLLKYWRPVKWLTPLSFSLHVPDLEICPRSEQRTEDLPWGFSPASNTKAKPSAYCEEKPCSSSGQHKKKAFLKLPHVPGQLPTPLWESESAAGIEKKHFLKKKKDFFFPFSRIFLEKILNYHDKRIKHNSHTDKKTKPQQWKIKLPLPQEIPCQQLKF